jgi:hypothetical protein
MRGWLFATVGLLLVVGVVGFAFFASGAADALTFWKGSVLGLSNWSPTISWALQLGAGSSATTREPSKNDHFKRTNGFIKKPPA